MTKLGLLTTILAAAIGVGGAVYFAVMAAMGLRWHRSR